MYDRLLKWPKHTSFLFGPRATGKSSWIKASNKKIYIVDLLDTTLSLRFEKSPDLFRHQVLAEVKPDQWIVVDEIQKCPRLLDEIHNLIENYGYKKFLLTGSSARKLRQSTPNLLGGRARNLSFYPLTAEESNFDGTAQERIISGCLPMAFLEKQQYEKEQYLQGYIENYLVDEIKRESNIRNMAGFQRFLEMAAICSSKPINQMNLSREAGISRDSVRLYFEVLTDTLIGYELPAFRERAKVKQRLSPKFYFFDSGVVNAAAGYFEQPAPSDWSGVLMETWLAHELRAYLDLNRIKGQLSYWATPSGTEVDFVWMYGSKIVLIEVKSSKNFRKDFLRGIKSFSASKKVAESFLIYLGDESLEVDGIHVLPAMKFLQKLYLGETQIQ